MTVKKSDRNRVCYRVVTAAGLGRTAWTMGRSMLAIGLLLLLIGPVIAEPAHAEETGTPAPAETIPVSEPTAVPTEPLPAIVETEVATEVAQPEEPASVPEVTDTETAGAPATPEEQRSEDTLDGGDEEFELAPDTSGTPTSEESPVPTVDVALPFAPVLECLPRDTFGIAMAGEGNWYVLECAIEWETADLEAVQLVARPLAPGWRVTLLDENDPESLEIPLSARLETGDHELDLPNTSFASDAASTLSTTFLLGAQLGCSSALSTIVELDITAHTQPDDSGAATLEETVTEAIELDGQPANVPDLHDLALTFSSIANSLDSWVSTGSFTLAYSGAPARCGWSISLGFADFTAGNYRIPAAQLTATAVSGIEGALVTSDQGVVTVAIAEGSTPRAATGVLVVTLELNIGSYLPAGNYQTVVTVDVARLP